MSDPLSAYLIIPRIAIYNDEWYDDYTESETIADPLRLLSDKAEAEAEAQRMAREYLRSTPVDELMLGETFEPSDDPELDDVLDDLFCQQIEALPADLTDAQIDEVLRLSDLKPFYVIEAQLSRADFAEAQALLDSTPEHPRSKVSYDPETGLPLDDISYDYPQNEAAERLNRVTQLFGRRYATEPLY